MFTEGQKALLAEPLDRAKVKKNPRGYDYVEGWHAIAEANRIFGFDGWHRETLDMRQLGEPEMVNGNWRVGYHCRVRISVVTDGRMIVRDGSGFGSGIVKDVRDAHESAIKEAETDAMKRALMTFGNPFGLALYDKAQAHVVDDKAVSEALAARMEYVVECREAIAAYNDAAALLAWWSSEDQKRARRNHSLDPEQVEALKKAVMNRRDALTQKAAA
jgi:DNA repair and recombination protein RAD52